MSRSIPAALFLLVALPGAATAAEADAKPDDAAWRAERPKVPPPPAPVLPSFTAAKLANGLTVLVTEVDALPVVSFNLVLKGGSTFDPKGKEGLTALTFDLLEEGAGTRGALAFSDAVADLGADFGAGANQGAGTLSISGLSRQADAMLTLLADAALRPRFDDAAFARKKAETIATLVRRRGSPQGIAMERFPGLVYGADHPYGHAPSGTVESIQALTAEEVRGHFAKIAGPQHAALVVAGDVGLATAKALAEKHFGAWKSEAAPPPAVPAVDPKKREQILVLDRPGAAQTMMIVGRPIFGRGHPDEYPLKLANEVFGGSFSSRLNMNLREDKGVTYGAGSQASFRAGVGAFLAYSALRADATGLGLTETFAEIGRLDSRPITAEELELARSALVRSLPGSFETVGSIAGAAGALFIYDLPLDHFATLGKRYTGATLDVVRAAAKTWMTADDLVILLVGDAKLIKSQLPDSLGAVEIESESNL